MKRLMLIALSALAVTASLIPAAQAGAVQANPVRAGAAAGSANTLTGRPPAAPQTVTRHITLSRHACAALSGHAAGCAMSESIHPIRKTANGDYFQGFLQVCGHPYSSGGCDTHVWWVTDSFNFTATSSQAWNNGTPQCKSNYTYVTWCSYVGNGTNHFQEGVNFSNGGWARDDLTASDFYRAGFCQGTRGSSGAKTTGWALDEAINAFYPCYPE
jgi:hypothetical protein